MSEEVVQETQEVEATPEGSKIDNLEDALKELDKVRKEAAGRRVKAREVEEKAQKWEEYVHSQKTELEKLTEAKSTLAEQNDHLQKQLLKNEVARTVGLDPEDYEFLVGDTKEELTAKAEKLKSRRGTAGSPDFFAGQRGARVNPPEEMTTQEYFAQMWKDADTKSSFKGL